MAILQNGHDLEWWTTEDRQPGTKVDDPTDADEGTYYAFFIPWIGNCDNPIVAPVDVSYSNVELKLLKSSVLVDADNNGIANVGDYITYTFTVENTGGTTVEDILLNDPQIGVVNLPIPNSIDPGLEETITFDYTITADVDNKSIYNLATVEGQNDLGCSTERSLD